MQFNLGASYNEIPRLDPYVQQVFNNADPRVQYSLLQAIKDTGVDPAGFIAQAFKESSFNPRAKSKWAQGLLGISPLVQKMYGVTDPNDPYQSALAGAKYKKHLYGRYKDNNLALAAYNAGPTAVDTAMGIPAMGETQNYVRDVQKLSNYRAIDARRKKLNGR